MTVLDFQRIGLDDDPPALVDYRWAWDEQRRIHAEVAAGRRAGTVLLLEHESVYTAGRRTLAHERPFDGTPVIDVDRGGKARRAADQHREQCKHEDESPAVGKMTQRFVAHRFAASVVPVAVLAGAFGISCAAALFRSTNVPIICR